MTQRDLAWQANGPTVCVGEILVEIVATTTGEGFCDPQPLMGPFPSGAPAIFIDQCGRFGGPAAMIGAVGADDFGRLCLARLRRDGVDVSAVATVPDRPTGSAFVRYRPDGARDFVFNIARSAAAEVASNPETEAVIAAAGHLHVMGSALSMPGAWAVIEPALAVIRARGGTVSLDPNVRKELATAELEARLAAVLQHCDLLLPSGEELEMVAGIAGEAAAVARLHALGIGEIVLKRGAGGATAFLASGLRIDTPALAVTEVDPTGAGDCFGGAYVASRRLGLDVAEALTYASAAGARNVTMRGPMEGAGTRAELDAFIAGTRWRD